MDVEDDERSETLSQVSSNASTEPLSPEALERKRAYQASQLSMSDADAAKPKPTRGGSLTSDLSNLSDDEQQSDPDTAAPQTGSPPQSVDASQPPEADALSTAATLLQAQPASPSAHDSHPSPENKNSLSTQPIDEAPHPQEAAFSLAPAPAPPTVPEPHSSADLHADNLFTSPKEGSQSSQKRKRARDDLAVDSDGDQPSPAEAESEFPIDESESKRQRTSELTEAQAAAATLNGFPQSGLQVPTPESPSRSTSPALSQQAEDASTADQLSNAQPDAQQPQHSGSEAGSDDGQELDEEDYDAEPADNTEGPQEDLEAAQAEQSSADEGAGDERSEGEEEEEPEEPDDADQNRMKAIEALFKIEVEFAKLRDALFLERMAEANHEKQLVQDETHPDMVLLNEYITSRRVTRLDIASQWLARLNQEYDVERQASERMVWSQWTEDRANLKSDLLDEVNGKRRALEREKRVSDRGNRDERLIALQNEHQERMVYQSQISEASIERNMIFTEQDLANAFRRQTIHREADFGMLGLPKETIAFDLTEMSTQYVAPRAMPNWSLGPHPHHGVPQQPPSSAPGAVPPPSHPTHHPHQNGFGSYGPPQHHHQQQQQQPPPPPPQQQTQPYSSHPPPQQPIASTSASTPAPASAPAVPPASVQAADSPATAYAPTPTTSATVPEPALPAQSASNAGPAAPSAPSDIKEEPAADTSMSDATSAVQPPQHDVDTPAESTRETSALPSTSNSTPTPGPSSQPAEPLASSAATAPATTAAASGESNITPQVPAPQPKASLEPVATPQPPSAPDQAPPPPAMSQIGAGPTVSSAPSSEPPAPLPDQNQEEQPQEQPSGAPKAEGDRPEESSKTQS